MQKIVAASLLATTLLSSAAFAQATVKAPAQVQAGDYAVEPGHTQVLFAVSHFGFTTYYGSFSEASGTLHLDPAKPASSTLQVTLPIASVATTSEKLTGELKDDKWFNAAAFPQAVFKSTTITPKGADAADVMGTLTLHGVTKPVTLHAKFMGAGVNPIDKKYTVGFQVTGTIKRSEFGVSTYVPMVGDDVNLTISGAFEKN